MPNGQEGRLKMPRIVAHLTHESGMVKDKELFNLLSGEWRRIVAGVVGTEVDHIEVIWLLHDHTDNAPIVSLDVMYTVGEHGLVTEDNAARYATALVDALRTSLLGSERLPAGEYGVWALPQNGARYESGVKETPPGE